MSNIFICPICYKIFKTNQHLNQHKNRKRKCQPFLENHNNSNNSENIILKNNISENNISENNISEMTTSVKNIISENIISENITSVKNIISENSEFELTTTPLININLSSSFNLTEDLASVNNDKNFLSSTNNDKSNLSIDNISVTNLLEFITTHKKILEEKNKLESTLVLLKSHIDKLTRENFDLKNKVHLVNNFITDYKSNETDKLDVKYSKYSNLKKTPPCSF